jgi:hypothetical protein
VTRLSRGYNAKDENRYALTLLKMFQLNNLNLLHNSLTPPHTKMRSCSRYHCAFIVPLALSLASTHVSCYTCHSRSRKLFGAVRPTLVLRLANGSSNEVPEARANLDTPTDAVSLAEQKEAVGNLVADDEWAGVTMELGELVKKAVIEDLKAKGRDFLGSDTYKMGDFSKEVDARIKQGVAAIRGKPEYEVGDLILSLDEMSKDMTEKLTGKPYEVGDLSLEIDRRVKKAVASYIGKEEYEAGDLTRAVSEKVSTRVDELTANYEFGDITRAVEQRRKEWMRDFLGEDAAANYKLGDISKKFATMITGKDEYQFGDVTKKVLGNLFGKKDTEKK